MRSSTFQDSFLLVAILFGLAGWAFWPALRELGERWMSDPQYCYCAAAPLAAAATIWSRRHGLPEKRNPALAGLLVVAAGLGVRWIGQSAFVESLESLGFILVLAGIVASVSGWRTLGWMLPAFILLSFALPPPYRVHSAMAEVLQRATAVGASALLVLRGRPAIAMGDVVIAGDERLSVVEACCGVGMLFVFLFVATLVVVHSRRPYVDRALVLLAAPFIGISVNILRIAATFEAKATGLAPDVVHRVHDVGGYLLGPAALLMLLLVLKLAALVFPEARPEDDPLQIAFQLGVTDQADFTSPRRARLAYPPSEPPKEARRVR